MLSILYHIFLHFVKHIFHNEHIAAKRTHIVYRATLCGANLRSAKADNGSEVMEEQPNERAILLGQYILEQRTTVRAAAKQFGISKSTVHKDVSERLPHIRPQLALEVREVLLQNKQERHIRGGLATKEKYARLAAGRE